MKKFSEVASRWLARLRPLLWHFEKSELSLIDDNDFTVLLKEIGRWDDLLNGKLQCSQCGTELTLDNISGFIVIAGEYQFFCNSQSCISIVNKS